MSRYYTAQYSDYWRGWVDIEGGAFKNKQMADKKAKEFAENNRRVTRTIRKPKGWEP